MLVFSCPNCHEPMATWSTAKVKSEQCPMCGYLVILKTRKPKPKSKRHVPLSKVIISGLAILTLMIYVYSIMD